LLFERRSPLSMREVLLLIDSKIILLTLNKNKNMKLYLMF
jgi:hypothetical protein